MTLSTKELLRLVDPRGRFSLLCHLQEGVWHLYVRVEGKMVDKGPCQHDHAEIAALDDCCCGREGCDGTGPWPD